MFDRQKIDALLDHWKWPFLAIKRSPAVDASIWMRKGAHQRLHATLMFSMELKAASQSKLLGFLEATSIRLQADFACLHLLTQSELERGRCNNTVRAMDKQGKQVAFFLTSRDLQLRVPELYWATVLGAPYLKLFGEERILSAPAYCTKALPSDAVLLQMTKDLTDLEERPTVFDAVRSRVKTWLGADAFFEVRNEGSSGYRVPDFKFFDVVGDLQ